MERQLQIWRKILFTIFMLWAYKTMKTLVIDDESIASESDLETLKYNTDVIDVGVALLVFSAIRHSLKHDMGIRTPFVCLNVLLHYLLICIRMLLLCAYTMWLYPTIIKITRESLFFPGRENFDAIQDSDNLNAGPVVNYLLAQTFRLIVFGVWFVFLLAIVFFFCCLKKMRLSCQPEWFFKYLKSYLLGYQRSMIV